jgi:hypothetical protein
VLVVPRRAASLLDSTRPLGENDISVTLSHYVRITLAMPSPKTSVILASPFHPSSFLAHKLQCPPGSGSVGEANRVPRRSEQPHLHPSIHPSTVTIPLSTPTRSRLGKSYVGPRLIKPACHHVWCNPMPSSQPTTNTVRISHGDS